jgi:hypothetical protein
MAKPPRKSNWTRQALRLKDRHGWTCKAGYRRFAADRGAARFDFPDGWIVRPADDRTTHTHDQEPPDDHVRLSLTVIDLRADVDRSGLKIPAVLREITANSTRQDSGHGPLVEVRHPRHELAGSATNYPDPENGRMVRPRTALARYSARAPDAGRSRRGTRPARGRGPA